MWFIVILKIILCQLKKGPLSPSLVMAAWDFSSLKTFGKSLFICHQNTDNYAELFDGSQYDFGFNPTESELLFYNSKSITDVNKRLKDSFTQLHEGENI